MSCRGGSDDKLLAIKRDRTIGGGRRYYYHYYYYYNRYCHGAAARPFESVLHNTVAAHRNIRTRARPDRGRQTFIARVMEKTG